MHAEKSRKSVSDFPSQEDAEKATKQAAAAEPGSECPFEHASSTTDAIATAAKGPTVEPEKEELPVIDESTVGSFSEQVRVQVPRSFN